MSVLIAIALKSLLVAGLALGLLALMKHRSAAERSWVAHIGLLALVVMAFAPLALPRWTVEAPALLGQAPAIEAPTSSAPPAFRTVPAPVAATASAAQDSRPSLSAAAAASAVYAIPAAILLLITFLALARLIALRARAEVLVDGHWLSALARAQRRMGFKSGTALLTSSELRSPVSWGLMRPVILLNDDAAEARNDAEAIIAHELAHVARLDWAKLLLARVVVALFWFNPLVWLLAREAHQLREEAADDAVLGSDIDDTDYARLLVGVARHECNGLLLGAHGVAPSRGSLSRRVRRVLDQALTRAPGGWRWTSAAAFFAAGMAVPVAALNFVPTTPLSPAVAGRTTVGGKALGGSSQTQSGVTPVTAATAAALADPHPDADDDTDLDVDVDIDEEMENAGREVRAAGREVASAFAEARTSLGASAVAVAHPSPRSRDPLDEAIAAKMMGVTPDYVREMRAASPELRDASMEDIIGMKTQGVEPEFVRELSRAGQTDLSAKRLTGAAVQGVDARYIREMASVGYGRASLKELTEMRMFGVSADYVRKFQKAGYKNLSAKQLVKMKTFNVQPDDVGKGAFDGP